MHPNEGIARKLAVAFVVTFAILEALVVANATLGIWSMPPVQGEISWAIVTRDTVGVFIGSAFTAVAAAVDKK